MRYLYGDSSPFPLQHDFLAAIQAFVPNATRAVHLDAEVRALLEQNVAKQMQRTEEIEALTAFHQAMAEKLRASPKEGAPPSILEYVRRVDERSAQVVAELRHISEAQGALEEQTCQAEVGRRRAEILSSLAALLSVLRVPSSRYQASWRLVDGLNELTASFTGPGDIEMFFRLRTPDLPIWKGARRVGEFIKGINLPVGVKRGWFSKGVQQEVVSLDEHIIAGVDVQGDKGQLRIAKPDGKDAVSFDVRRVQDRLDLEMRPTGELDPESQAKLAKLWDALSYTLQEEIYHREKLLTLQMGGEEVVSNDSTTALVQKLIAELTSVVAEIARRSSNVGELCLKFESDQGRREELYVNKAQLLQHIAALAPAERAVFEPLKAAIQKRPVARTILTSDEPPSMDGSVEVIVSHSIEPGPDLEVRPSVDPGPSIDVSESDEELV